LPLNCPQTIFEQGQVVAEICWTSEPLLIFC
jgi:hypothetical protein